MTRPTIPQRIAKFLLDKILPGWEGGCGISEEELDEAFDDAPVRHPSAGRYCPWCGSDSWEKEPCDSVKFDHAAKSANFCHICRAARGEPCDAGLHA
jgi:hypothetical protein